MVVIFNAGLHEIHTTCHPFYWNGFSGKMNISDDDIQNCATFYIKNFKRLLDLITSVFPSDLKIFRTTNAAWTKWGNFGFAWPPECKQDIVRSPHTIHRFNDMAIQIIKSSGYDVKVYDLFWMTWSRPDDTEISDTNAIENHMVHLGVDTLRVSLRKMITMVNDYFECF
jgi:hypothetical protein